MVNGIYTTVIGNLVADPELRFTPSGIAVANFTIANTPRFMKDNEWQDGETTFVRCNLWNTYAEHAADSLEKGQHVLAYGRIGQRTWENREGETQYTWEMTVEEIGISLRFGTSAFTKDAPKRPPVPAEKNKTVPRKPKPKTRGKRPSPELAAAADPWETDYDGDD